MNPKPSVDVMPMTSPLCRADGQPIPLLASRLVGELVGGLARLTSTQHYKNAETTPIEAIYTFPLPSDATVSGFTMTVEGRRIEAVVEEREEAIRQYDNAMVEGHGAALLEQERTNVFTAKAGGYIGKVYAKLWNVLSVERAKIDVKMPSDSVTAKPRMGPDPSQNMITAAASVVSWLSAIVTKARVKPASIAAIVPLPARSSSRMRS